MFIITQEGERMVYAIAEDILRLNKMPVQTGVLSQGYLRSEIPISANTTNYKVPILNTDITYGQPGVNEVRLTINDVFVTSAIFIGLTVAATGVATAEVLTYADPAVFTTGGAAVAANTLYNGRLQGTVNQNTVMPNWDIMRHRFVPRTQDGIIGGTGGGTPLNSTNLATTGFYPMQPLQLQGGTKNLQWQIVLPAAIATVQANAKIVFIQRGVLAQNVWNPGVQQG